MFTMSTRVIGPLRLGFVVSIRSCSNSPIIIVSSFVSPLIPEKISVEKNLFHPAQGPAAALSPPPRSIDVAVKNDVATSTGFLIYRRRSIPNIDVDSTDRERKRRFLASKLSLSSYYITFGCASILKLSLLRLCEFQSGNKAQSRSIKRLSIFSPI